MKKLAIIIILFIVHSNANAQIDKWIRKEVIPTITGERPLRVKPYVRVSSGGKTYFRYSSQGNGSFYLDAGVARIQTSNLRKRAAQTAAILYGNQAVMAQVAREQYYKQLERQRRAYQRRYYYSRY